MPKKALFFIITLALLLFPAAALADGNAVNSNDLIDHAKDYDQKTVVFEGEVVGDILMRQDHAWLAVSDGSNTIGVWVTAQQAEQLSFVGKYGVRGDTVRIEGVFHRACAEHGGDLDIHADSVSVLAVGTRVQMPVSRLVVILSIALPLPAVGLLLYVWKKRAGTRNDAIKMDTLPDRK